MKNVTKVSRRDVLRSAGTVAAVGLAAGSEVHGAARASVLRSKIPGAVPRTLALIGDRNHNPDYIRVGLDRLFKELGLPIDYTVNYDHLSRTLLSHYQLFVGFRDNMISPAGYGTSTSPDDGYLYETFLENPAVAAQGRSAAWITEEQGEAVKDFVAAGNGFYSLHNNAFVSRSSKNYRDVQGGLALGHPPLRPFKVRIVNKEHPITQGVEDFMVTDEQHFAIYDKDPKNILLHGENLDGLTFPGHGNDLPHFYAEGVDYRQALRRTGSAARGAGGGSGEQAAGRGAVSPGASGTVSISGWAHDYGQGRVAFTAMGHTIHSMWQPEYLKVQKNAVRWLLRIT